MAVIGAAFVDKIGRRPLLIWTNVACCVCWIGVTIATAEQAQSKSAVSSKACLAMVYIFQICYSFGWTPMQALYPVEVLSFEMRAKGMAFSNFFVAAGMLFAWFSFLPLFHLISITSTHLITYLSDHHFPKKIFTFLPPKQAEWSHNSASPSPSKTSNGKLTSSFVSGAPYKPPSSTFLFPRPRTARWKNSMRFSKRKIRERRRWKRKSWR